MGIIENIIITSAGRRVSLVKSFQQEIQKMSLGAKVFCTDLVPELSSACQVADNSFKVSRVTDNNYVSELISICIENNVGLVIPTIDTELKILALNRNKFEEKGIIPLVSDLDFVEKCRDKRQIHAFFDKIGLKRAIEYKIDNLAYPVFVKPSDGSRSVGIHLLMNECDLTEEIISNPKNMFLEYLSPKTHAEFTVDIYFNKNSEIISIVPRERIFVRDGEVNKACARKNEIISIVRDKFANVTGLYGCITLQVFKHKQNNEVIGIEINPRFGGGYPLSYIAGANFSKWIIQEYILNENVTGYNDDWENNTLMLRYDAEIVMYGYKG